MPRMFRMTLVLLLTLTLGTTAVLAAPLRDAEPWRSGVAVSEPMDFAARLWSWLARVWGRNSGVQTKNGSQMDPNGGSLQAPPSATTNSDNGSQMDPDGLR